LDHQVVSCTLSGRPLVIETGEVAKQANGAAIVRYGETMVFAAVTAAATDRTGIDFFPLTVDYRERTYAAGKIPGGFFKREGRPSEKETLTSRIIDRPLRPLFPDAYRRETQVQCLTLSADLDNDPDIVGIIAASAALSVSDVPFMGPIGAVRMGYVDGKIIVNPNREQLEHSKLNMTVAGTREAIMMVEGGAEELPEPIVLQALQDAHQALQACIDLQLDLKERVGKETIQLPPIQVDTELRQRLQEMAQERLGEILSIPGKQEREEAMSALKHDVMEALGNDADTPEAVERAAAIGKFMHEMESVEMRRQIIRDGKRADGRGTTEIRPISGRTGLLPRSHGSVLFTRGETQALVVTTLGTPDDEQMIDGLEGKHFRRFMLHYNFPPYSVGEVRPLRGPGRREIGHGALAERAMLPVIPAKDSLPYTIRIVSEIMESNGSSAMATVCGSSLALMDAGVSIKAPVAGIAMGLIEQDGEVAILSDILGLEDHLGDMDFKVAGTTEGITAIQMDIKTTGVSREIMAQALEQARQGRLHILKCMEDILQAPRMELSTHAPRIMTLKIQRDKVRDIIGPGGKIIKGIVEKTGVNIDVKDDGSVVIAAANEGAAQAAIDIILELTQEAEIGRIYQGRVRKIMDFGAFVEIFPGTDGLLHISQISDKRVNKVTDELQEGDNVLVKVLDVDQNGRIKLSHKEAVRERETAEIN